MSGGEVHKVEVRKIMPSARIDRAEFDRRFRENFQDPAFAGLAQEIARLADVAWDGYDNSRKSPVTHPAGPGYADPDYELSDEWRAASAAVKAAQARHDDPTGPTRLLLINGAMRNENTCPGESSKTWRLLQAAREELERNAGLALEVLDLSRLTSEYERVIYPCKTCVSTAMPLCHWPCSCYPNHSLGQVNDWMNEIYPLWTEAHGIMILCPVNWYQVPSGLKLMIDRLVCADGGNPDPTSTQGKEAALAKKLELQDWPYPRHLAGRAFSVIVHGDADGVGPVRDHLANWLTDMQLVAAAGEAQLGRYIGYMAPYATSHDALDEDVALFEETRIAARSLLATVTALRQRGVVPAHGEPGPRPK
jgi:multimeric flavodoxin WrbA